MFYYVKWRNYLLVALTIPLTVLFCGLSVLFTWDALDTTVDAYRDEGVIDMIKTSIVYVTIVGMAAFLTIASFLIIIRAKSNMPALVIDYDGVEGYGWFKRKRFEWAEIELICATRDVMKIIRRSKRRPSFLAKALPPELAEDSIDVMFSFVDLQERRLTDVIRKYVPQGWQGKLDDS